VLRGRTQAPAESEIFLDHGKRCDPFTITDAHSRYLIRCQIVSRMAHPGVIKLFPA
jgi:hypothetical protein